MLYEVITLMVSAASPGLSRSRQRPAGCRDRTGFAGVEAAGVIAYPAVYGIGFWLLILPGRSAWMLAPVFPSPARSRAGIVITSYSIHYTKLYDDLHAIGERIA